MNPTSPSDARKIFSKIASAVSLLKKVETVICPPAIFLSGCVGGKTKSAIKLGAQDIFYENDGAYTGHLSASMFRSLGVSYCLIGHSERRKQGENDEVVNRKIKAGLKAGLRIILCVGEEIHDDRGLYLQTLRGQLESGLKNIPRKYFERIIIAHEPVWAIGADARQSDTAENFRHNRLFIRKVLADLAGKKNGLEVLILYGGSVNKRNALGFLTVGEADGLLIGRSSLIPLDFLTIARQANTLA